MRNPVVEAPCPGPSDAGPGGGGVRATHYNHMHTSRGCVCLAWGYRGMYAIIAISRLCREESLKGSSGPKA